MFWVSDLAEKGEPLGPCIGNYFRVEVRLDQSSRQFRPIRPIQVVRPDSADVCKRIPKLIGPADSIDHTRFIKSANLFDPHKVVAGYVDYGTEKRSCRSAVVP